MANNLVLRILAVAIIVIAPLTSSYLSFIAIMLIAGSGISVPILYIAQFWIAVLYVLGILSFVFVGMRMLRGVDGFYLSHKVLVHAVVLLTLVAAMVTGFGSATGDETFVRMPMLIIQAASH